MRASAALFGTCVSALLVLSGSTVDAGSVVHPPSPCPALDRALDHADDDAAMGSHAASGPFAEMVARIRVAETPESEAATRRYFELLCAETADRDS